MADQIDLVTWLRTQLDEDERNSWGSGIVAWLTYRRDDGGMGYTTVASATTSAPDYWTVNGFRAAKGWATARVIHDERQVRVEVEAKRRILDAHATSTDAREVARGTILEGATKLRLTTWDEAVRLLALPYADREGYDEAWRPAT